MLKSTEELLGEKAKNTIHEIPRPNHTVKWRIKKMVNDI